MFINVRTMEAAHKCRIVSWGHTEVTDDPRFEALSQAEFIKRKMSEAARRQLLGEAEHNSDEAIAREEADWISKTGITRRVFFGGSTSELAAIAAKKCLAKAQILPGQLDVIIGGTNTGPGYPSLADHIKLALGDSTSSAVCWDISEACPVGAISVFNGWSIVRSGIGRYVLVVCAEKATTLAPADNWLAANLFGDASFGLLLSVGDKESFQFFDGHCLPFDGNIDKVVKTEHGFSQDGPSVHKFVGREVVDTIVQAARAADLDPGDIDHFIPHQPSGKTLELLRRKLQSAWPTFSGHFHDNVGFTGNVSGASTGSVISRKIEQGIIKPGDRVFVSTFGSGLSIFNYGFRA